MTPTFNFIKGKSIFLRSCCEKKKDIPNNLEVLVSVPNIAKYVTLVTFPIDHVLIFSQKCDSKSDSHAETNAVTSDFYSKNRFYIDKILFMPNLSS